MGSSASVEYSEARFRATRSTSTSEINEKEKSKKGVTEEINDEKEKIFENLNQAIDGIKLIKDAADFRTENGNWNDDLLTSLEVFNKTFNILMIDSLSYDVIKQYRNEAGQRLSESKSTSVMCKMIMDSWQRGYKDEKGRVVSDQYVGVSKALSTLHNFSDCTRDVTYDIVKEPNFLETINRILIAIFAENLKGKAQDEDVLIMFRCLCLYDNLSKVDENISKLRSLEIVPILSFFLHAEKEIFRLVALSCLANVINEKKSAILQDKRDVVEFLMKTLSSAVKDPYHMCTYGIAVSLLEQECEYRTGLSLSAQECALTVRRLGRNEANKILLVELGFLPLLADLARNGNVEEQREAEYAFKRNKKIIPLKMEEKYEPDGWLGIIIGTRLFYEFSGKYRFEAKIKELIRGITISYGNEDLQLEIRPNNYHHEDTMETGDYVWIWTPDHVKKWIEKHNLPKKNFEKLTGKDLALLVRTRSEAPEFFYNCLQKNLGITSLLTMAMFLRGLDDLSI